MPVTDDARLYDIVNPDAFPGDIDWYRRKAREANGDVLVIEAQVE
jgi:hypothetical protein